MSVSVKICGITDSTSLNAAVNAGASFIGFVFYPASPRVLSPEKAAILAAPLPSSVKSVALFVNPTEMDLQNVLGHFKPDFIQLHGEESLERLLEIKQIWNIPLIKAIKLSSQQDLTKAKAYESVADWLLFDAPSAMLPGGNGIPFDWNILKNQSFKNPWMLSGGLTPDNVYQAIQLTGAKAVDVSSGVESRPGVKDLHKISNFCQKACAITSKSAL